MRDLHCIGKETKKELRKKLRCESCGRKKKQKHLLWEADGWHCVECLEHQEAEDACGSEEEQSQDEGKEAKQEGKAPEHQVDDTDPVIRHLFESKGLYLSELHLLMEREAWAQYSDSYYLDSVQELVDLLCRWGGSLSYTSMDGDFHFSFNRVTGVPFRYSAHHPRGPWSRKAIGAERQRDESDSDSELASMWK